MSNYRLWTSIDSPTSQQLANAPHKLPARLKETLLLRCRSFIRLGLSPLLPHPHKPGLTSSISQLPVRTLLTRAHLACLDLADSILPGLVDNWQYRVCLAHDFALLVMRCDLLFRRIRLLVLARAAREDYQTGLIGLEAGHIYGEGFFGKVGTARVDGNADCGGVFARDTGFLGRKFLLDHLL